MQAEKLMEILGADFYTGVPDSQLKALCNCLMNTYGIDPQHHIIAANEGNCAALAAGYHLATGKVPVVYMQNSGEGNIINPAASLLNDKVYAIPMIFVIGWRGEPGIHDEPQHIYQGEVTLKLLEDMGIASFVIGKETTDAQLAEAMQRFRPLLEKGLDVAFVVRKGALSYDGKVKYQNDYPLKREEIIRRITAVSGNDPIVSTTGKASRELFEIRTAAGETHARDFLTVGSMGHSSSIALGVALHADDHGRLFPHGIGNQNMADAGDVRLRVKGEAGFGVSVFLMHPFYRVIGLRGSALIAHQLSERLPGLPLPCANVAARVAHVRLHLRHLFRHADSRIQRHCPILPFSPLFFFSTI